MKSSNRVVVNRDDCDILLLSLGEKKKERTREGGENDF